ncbi:hypothetical protein [[Eubacterium] cellulosolvens]
MSSKNQKDSIVREFSQTKLLEKYQYFSNIHKMTIIIGDISTGKTNTTALLIIDALKSNSPNNITIIELAPRKTIYKEKTIGGMISDIIKLPSGIRLLHPKKIHSPRYSAKDKDELLNLVEENKISIDIILNDYISNPTPILFINDLSIYLQSGKWETIFEVMQKAEVSLANAYYGSSLENDLKTGISKIERETLEIISSKVDMIIHL